MTERVEFDPDERVARTTRKIGKSGNSIVIRIPPQILEVADFEVGEQVELVADMGAETITVSALEVSDAGG